MTAPRPQYAPGDPVLVAGIFRGGPNDGGDYLVGLAQDNDNDGYQEYANVRASDVHPVPPTPDPRDTAIAAVRARHHERKIYRAEDDGTIYYDQPLPSICGECSDESTLADLDDCCLDDGDGGARPWPCATWEALDGFAPVPAPPAPTPTGWTAERVGDVTYIRDAEGEQQEEWLDAAPSSSLEESRSYHAGMAEGYRQGLALRAGKAAAAVPATTDADQVALVTDTLVDMACADPGVTARRVLAELRRFRAAGSPQ